VLPKIRATLLGVTIKTGVVQRLLHELQIVSCAMIAMTAAAIHLALTYWVSVGLQGLRSLLLVTIETDLRLRRSYQNRILRRMARVAVGAGNLVDVMIVAVPAKARIRSVAIHAEAVPGVDRCGRTLSEDGARSGALLTAAYSPGVIAGRSMAGLALQLAVSERPVRVCRVCMCTLEYREDYIFLVTLEAGICALAAVIRVLTGSGAGGQEH